MKGKKTLNTKINIHIVQGIRIKKYFHPFW